MSEALRVTLTFAALAAELIALFLLVSMAVVLLNRKLGEKRLQSWLAGGTFVAPLKGIVLGALTPFCSCSTLPMLLGMLKAGAPFSAAAAFLISSPLLDPIILGVVALLFGWKIMVGYAAVTFVTTLLLALLWDKLGLAKDVKRVRVAGSGEHEEPWRGFKPELRPAWEQTKSGMKPLLLPLFIGLSVGALVYGFVPESFLLDVAGPGSFWAVPIAAIVGIPLYVRTESALPVGLALTSAGMGIGPVFALIIGGAGASIPEVSMLTAVFKPRLVATFVGSILAVAITGGFLIPLFA